jgi:ubiquinone/menaquinone biosynthesis C-methylase UbiE
MRKMKVEQRHRFFPRLFTLALLAGLWRVYDRRSRDRTASNQEIEDPEVAAGFGWVSGTPQMRWLRNYIRTQVIALQDHGEAVDLGCGPGLLVTEMALHAPGLHVTGIDLSQEMLESAREFARQAGVGDRVDFRLGNVEAIPFPDGSLDLVVSTLSLHHWADPLQVLNEVNRVLKPGGVFYIFDLRRDMAPPFYLLIWFATQFIVPGALHRVNEPMGSRNASYTIQEVIDLASRSNLGGGQAVAGPLWVVLQGKKKA